MQPLDDGALLRQFADNQSNEAFAALVSRHVSLVYSVALRQAGNPHHAEEIAQAVFIILARKAGQLRHDQALASWLFQTTRLTANNLVRREIRRRRREQEVYMESVLNEPDSGAGFQPARTWQAGSPPHYNDWEQIAPLLDAAVGALGEKDRRAIVLRFYEGRDLRDVGQALGASEAAAEKRVSRALEKLRRFFTKRGVDSTTAAIAETISANSVQAAPVALTKTISAVAMAKGAAASGSTLTLVKGALKIMAWTKAKTAIVVGVAAILAVGTTTTFIFHHNHQVTMQTDFSRASWKNTGYATPEDTAQTLFWALREGSTNTFQAYLNGFTPELQMKLESEAQSRGSNAFAELAAHEMGGVTRYRILKKIMLSDQKARLQIQFGGLKGPVQTLAMEKIGNEWKCAGE